MKQAGWAAAALLGVLWTAAPAYAQLDLGGGWASRMHEDWGDRFHGPDAVDASGLALNDDGRARLFSYSSSQLAMRDRICIEYPPYYITFGPQPLQIWSEEEPVTSRLIAWHISGAVDRTPRTIWMDGRPHPSANALHTFGGFSTGVWEGDVLTVTTTHMKGGPIRRNGVPSSDEAVVTEHFARHGDVLTVTAIVDDPAILAEPHIVSRSWQLDPAQTLRRYSGLCYASTEISRLDGPEADPNNVVVPHYLPGKNPYMEETAERYHLPLDALYGQAETRYPEYRKKIKDAYVAPKTCVRYCCGWLLTGGVAGNRDAPELNCTPAKVLTEQ